MKMSTGMPNLGFFIDRTIQQCLEYDLDVSDTDAVLEEMAKAWPAQGSVGQRRQRREESEQLEQRQEGRRMQHREEGEQSRPKEDSQRLRQREEGQQLRQSEEGQRFQQREDAQQSGKRQEFCRLQQREEGRNSQESGNDNAIDSKLEDVVCQNGTIVRNLSTDNFRYSKDNKNNNNNNSNNDDDDDNSYSNNNNKNNCMNTLKIHSNISNNFDKSRIITTGYNNRKPTAATSKVSNPTKRSEQNGDDFMEAVHLHEPLDLSIPHRELATALHPHVETSIHHEQRQGIISQYSTRGISSLTPDESENLGDNNITVHLGRYSNDAEVDRNGDSKRASSCDELMRREMSKSCDELLRRESLASRGAERRHTNPSPEMARGSPTSGLPTKLKSRLQLRYLEDKDGKVSTQREDRFSETIMDANASRNSTSESLDRKQESPIHGAKQHGENAPINASFSCSKDRKRPRSISHHENETAFAKRIRRETQVGFSNDRHQQLKAPQLISLLQPLQQGAYGEDHIVLGKSDIHPKLANCTVNAEMSSGVNLSGPLRQGLDLARIPSACVKSQVKKHYLQYADFLPNVPNRSNSALPVRPRDLSFVDVNDVVKCKELRTEQQHHYQNRDMADPLRKQYHQQKQHCKQLQQQEQQKLQQLQHVAQHPNHCICQASTTKQTKTSQHHHNKFHSYQQRQSHDHCLKTQRPLDWIQCTQDARTIQASKSNVSFKNPMHSISSIIVEELQKDNRNGLSDNKTICYGTVNNMR